jgi:hypothetical protein
MVLRDQTLTGLIHSIYPGIAEESMRTRDYFSTRAILAGRNEEVSKINAAVLEMVPGDQRDFFSADSVGDADGADIVSVEYLNSMELNGWPPHKLSLKVGTPVLLLRNLNPADGLCNGTRLMIRRFLTRVIEVEIIGGEQSGNLAFLPRLSLISEDSGLPYPIQRKQFPIRVAYAMTIHKSQGQTIPNVGVSLRNDVFSHGQLYVAFSRATALENVKVLFEERARDSHMTRNVVYQEALL